MNKTELVDALAVHFAGSRPDATRALNAFVHTISAATAAGERVSITGFGVFERVERPARTVRNPRTGERLDVAATAVPRFRAGTELKAYVSGQRAVPDLGAPPPVRRTTTTAAAEAAPAVAVPSPTPTAKTKTKASTKASTKAKTKAKEKDKEKDKGKGKGKPTAAKPAAGSGKKKASAASGEKDAASGKKKGKGKK